MHDENKPSATRQLDWLWENCKIVYRANASAYPIEHNMAAGKDLRALLEHEMREDLRGGSCYTVRMCNRQAIVVTLRGAVIYDTRCMFDLSTAGLVAQLLNKGLGKDGWDGIHADRDYMKDRLEQDLDWEDPVRLMLYAEDPSKVEWAPDHYHDIQLTNELGENTRPVIPQRAVRLSDGTVRWKLGKVLT